jgi:translation initiation factor 4A
MLAGRDLVAQSRSGTGKTAAYCIAALQLLDTSVRKCQVLVLSPTRELAHGIRQVARSIGDFMQPPVVTYACVGGVSVRDDMKTLEEGVHLLVGTPGRVNDMIVRGKLSLANLKLFILDEVDELLSRGFLEQINDLVTHLPSKRQVCFFSSCIPAEVEELVSRLLKNPAREVQQRSPSLQNVQQYYIAMEKEEWKLDTLCDLYEVRQWHVQHTQCSTHRFSSSLCLTSPFPRFRLRSTFPASSSAIPVARLNG